MYRASELNREILEKISEWIAKERTLGSPEPDQGILATSSLNGIPSSRVVDIREITEKGLLFFSQKKTRKVDDLLNNPHASLTLWLPLQQREIVFDGMIEPLPEITLKHYWNTIPRDRKLRFITIASILDKNLPPSDLEEEHKKTISKHHDPEIYFSDSYYGFTLVPHSVYFYTLNPNGFSIKMRFTQEASKWNSHDSI